MIEFDFDFTLHRSGNNGAYFAPNSPFKAVTSAALDRYYGTLARKGWTNNYVSIPYEAGHIMHEPNARPNADSHCIELKVIEPPNKPAFPGKHAKDLYVAQVSDEENPTFELKKYFHSIGRLLLHRPSTTIRMMPKRIKAIGLKKDYMYVMPRRTWFGLKKGHAPFLMSYTAFHRILQTRQACGHATAVNPIRVFL